MSVLRDLVVKISIQSEGKKKIEDINEKLDELYNLSEKITMSLYRFGEAFFNVAGKIEQTTLAIEVMSGSAEIAEELVDKLEKFATKTPFRMTDLMLGTKQLMAANFQADEIIDTMTTLGTVASATGGDISRVLAAYAKMRERDRATMLEINSLVRNGVPIFSALQDQIGVTGDELRKMISGGQVPFSEVKKAMEYLEKTRFKGMLGRQANTYLGILQNIQDAWARITRLVGTALLPVLKQFFGTILQILDSNEELIASGIEMFFRGLMFTVLALAAAIEKVVMAFIHIQRMLKINKFVAASWKFIIMLVSAFLGLIIGIAPILMVVLKGSMLIKLVLKAIALIVGFIGIKVLLIIAAIAAVIAVALVLFKVGKYIYENWDSILNKMKEAANFMKESFLDGLMFSPNLVAMNEIEQKNSIAKNDLARPSSINNSSNSKKEVNVKIEAGPGVDLSQKMNMEKVARAVFEEQMENEQNIIYTNSYVQE